MPETPPDTDVHDAPRDGLFIRLYFGDGRFLGPGKIELLETIRTEQSILSAARKMGMSYRPGLAAGRRAGPHVQPARGRDLSGSARPRHRDSRAFGEKLIGLYRGIERDSAKATRKAAEELRAALADDWQETQAAHAAKAPAAPTLPANRRQRTR